MNSDLIKYRRAERTTDDSCNAEALNKLDVLNLINAAEISDDCSKLAAEVFQRKYANTLFRIEKNPLPYAADANAVIPISTYESATNMIRHFGNSIKKLSIQIDNDAELCTELQVIETVVLLMAINARCRESLVEFELHYNGCNINHIFHQLSDPFENVEILSLHLFDMVQQNGDRQLNQVFPNVRELIIDFHKIHDPLFIDGEFSKLKKLGIADGLIYESNESILIDLLKKNSQITYVSLIRPSIRALRLVNKHLTHLEDLHILMDSPEGFSFTKITFPSVKRLNLWLSTDKCFPPKKIAFGTALREIALVCRSGDENESYINFLLKYPKIEQLSAGNGLNNVHLLKLIGKFSRLSNVFLDFSKDVSVTNIIEFIKKTPSLNRLEFIHAYIEQIDAFENQLKHELGTDFNIQYYDMEPSVSRRFTITRKIPVVNVPENADGSAPTITKVGFNAVFIISVAAFIARLLVY